MLESELKEKLVAIFGMKVTYDRPSDSSEQDVLFVELEQPVASFSDGVENVRIRGTAILYAPSKKIQMGHLARCISIADNDLIKDFFFQDVDANTRMFRDIVGRGFTFTYFFRGQFNPPAGKILSVDFKE